MNKHLIINTQFQILFSLSIPICPSIYLSIYFAPSLCPRTFLTNDLLVHPKGLPISYASFLLLYSSSFLLLLPLPRIPGTSSVGPSATASFASPPSPRFCVRGHCDPQVRIYCWKHTLSRLPNLGLYLLRPPRPRSKLLEPWSVY